MRKGVFLILGGLVAIGGFYLYQQYKFVDYLCYSIKKFSVKKFSLENTVLSAVFNIKNKGGLEVDIKRVDLKILSRGVELSKISSKKKVSIVSGKETELPIDISVKTSELIKDVKSLLSTHEINSIPLTIKGRIIVEKAFLPIVLPIDMTYTIGELLTPSGSSTCS